MAKAFIVRAAVRASSKRLNCSNSASPLLVLRNLNSSLGSGTVSSCLKNEELGNGRGRRFSTAFNPRQAVVNDSAVPPPSSSSTSPEGEVTVSEVSNESTTSGRKRRRARQFNEKEKAAYLLKWEWYPVTGSPHRAALEEAIKQGTGFPSWLNSDYEMVKSYRSARSRLWIPNSKEASVLEDQGTVVEDVEVWLEDKLEKHRESIVAESQGDEASSAVIEWDMLDNEKQLDVVLKPLWKKLSLKEREDAMLRARFECIWRLGWRHGYSSGYPRPYKRTEDGKVDEVAHLPENFGKRGKEGLEASRKLLQGERERAWQDWSEMTPRQRISEEKEAWKQRDRSQIYLDDSPYSTILGVAAPRWYPVAERVGKLCFLPNVVVKLVKNHTPEGQAYDPFKATFRVPLSMHKHALRSYLLSIYGLKTTWARSSVYRSTVTRDMRTGKKITGSGRTWKKVEVGLLEPFLFPEVSPEFLKEHMQTSELDHERARVYLKFTKTSRWRSKKPVEQYEQEVTKAEAKQFHGLSTYSLNQEDLAKVEKMPRVAIRTTGIPSDNHGKILQLLNQKREVKEKAVRELMEKYKRENAEFIKKQQQEA
ncbi:hypothetical protein IE53DRAFT_385973 [Violaceomyces palustris]|uniref:Uncharacterized protein n=1 Tax=Violaceomyces palustris TaxID=1673888 RepID=A0ACD0P0Q5_9BASI|nr:hypothetical protein IE53DRAFT_385973 [Violaceomyces palustris]